MRTPEATKKSWSTIVATGQAKARGGRTEDAVEGGVGQGNWFSEQ
jgi:hypothetical protein